MLTRISTAAVALAAFLPVLYFSGTIVFPIIMALLCVVGIYELYGCINMKQCRAMYLFSLAAAAVFPITARCQPRLIISLAILLVCVTLAVSVFGYSKYKADILGFTCFETLVILLGISLMVVVRDREPLRYLLIFVAAWTTDTFAYFSGIAFGKKKLCPEISPKKTVAGAIGGAAGCVISFIIFGIICNGFFDKSYSLWLLAAIAVPLSVIGQVGDLAASAVKRHYGVKDFGKLFPGHGGVLDRFDSILPITLLAFILTEIYTIC
ncbi:MAG: phosphatidate cytidylyltransferase [Eubacteriales bacterium]|nr:phosphatidate cytidylyltransferase [Eubacteriales bacterium]